MVCSRDCTFPVKHDDLDQFFSHENRIGPPSLSNGGKVRLWMKADLLHFLEPNPPENRSTPSFDAIVLDSAAVVQMLKHERSKILRVCRHDIFNHTRGDCKLWKKWFHSFEKQRYQHSPGHCCKLVHTSPPTLPGRSKHTRWWRTRMLHPCA